MIKTMRTDRNRKCLDEFAQTLPADGLMVEVGSYAGEGAEIFARYVWHLTCVDLWPQSEVLEAWRNRTDYLGNVNGVRMPSVDAARMFADGSLDVVYIDAAHDYESVKADILAWRPKLKPGGILAGHDYGPHAPGVIQAVDELIGKPSRVYGETTWRA